MGTKFDFIVAYSVFTHTTREEMHDIVRQLRSRLKKGGHTCLYLYGSSLRAHTGTPYGFRSASAFADGEWRKIHGRNR